MELDVDEYKQRDKEKNIMIAGLDQDQMIGEGMTEVLKNKLKYDIHKKDIYYIVKMMKRDD